jgi:serine protease Do
MRRPTFLLALVFLAAGVADGAPTPHIHDVPSAIEQALRVSVMIEADGVYGAGVLIDPPRGLILTDYHVVEEMKTPRASLRSGKSGEARIVSFDRQHDLALLSAPALRDPRLEPPTIADASAMRPGEELFSIGMPRKLAYTVSRGIVSFVGREYEGAPYLQIDMNINDGNSGGPVVNSSGELVAVMSFIYRHSNGLTFAMPVAEAARVFPQLQRSR